MCPCGSQKSMEECCGPYLNGTAVPETAEQLMRSRYTAFTVGDIKYIRQTTGGEALKDFKDAEALEWSKAKWRGLKVLSTKKGTASDREGVVEFTAKYEQGGKVLEHHEVSKFRRDPKGQWVFVDGDAHVHEGGGGHHHHHHAPIAPVVRESPKVGRNDPCPCGSGQKYKKCCGAAA